MAATTLLSEHTQLIALSADSDDLNRCVGQVNDLVFRVRRVCQVNDLGSGFGAQ